MTPHPKLAGVLPALQDLARQHLLRCEAKGLTVVVTSGWRSPQEQMDCYSKGRRMNLSGVWEIVKPGEIVTHAMPAQAPHCRGAAYDVCPIVAEKCAWDRLDLFQAIADCAAGLPLVWGGRFQNFKDLPHYELPTWRALPLKES